MTDRELIAALRRIGPETGSLCCLGCGYEHGCSVHGCAVIRAAITEIEHPAPPPNTPLTLDELQGMDNVDLAMLEIKIMPEKGQFRICECSNGEFLIGLKSLPISEYGKTWLAYRRKIGGNNE